VAATVAAVVVDTVVAKVADTAVRVVATKEAVVSLEPDPMSECH
jgi:hypothetical protein